MGKYPGMIAGRCCATQGADHHQSLEQRNGPATAHRCTNERKDGNQQQAIALQDTQRAWRLVERNLHVQRAADHRQADEPQQHQKPPLAGQPRIDVTHGFPFIRQFELACPE